MQRRNFFPLFSILFVCCQPTLAQHHHKTITTYSDLESTLTQGHTVRFIMDFNKCTPAFNSVGGMNFAVFNKYQVQINGETKNTIATSSTILTHHNKFGPVYSFVRLRVFEDNSAEVFSEFLDPKNYSQLSSATFACHLSDGKTQGGVTLLTV